MEEDIDIDMEEDIYIFILQCCHFQVNFNILFTYINENYSLNKE